MANMNEFARWWDGSNAAQKRELAARLTTSRAYLSQIRHGHRTPSRYFLLALGPAVEAMRRD